MTGSPVLLRRREMGVGHAELFRLLPRLVPEGAIRREPGRIVLADGPCRVAIDYGPEEQRRLAAVRLPVTRLAFRFDGCDETAADAFMARFDRLFHRGGG